MYKCSFWGRGGGFLHVKNWKNLIGTVLVMVWYRKMPEHASVHFRTPLISLMMTHFNLFSSGSVEIIFQSAAIFFYDLLCSETLFSSCWRHRKYLFHEFTIFRQVFLRFSGRASTWTLATAAAAILESVADPNLTSEKVMGEIFATVHIPDSWHVYS